ncbi:hypothetical protein [Aliarcobacter butzleri]|uniref:Uncharacterized protein n=1 Tax=Aliarcobacter butzleri TaxID=28197 RepID=A0AAP4UXW8_9BACT|nr:hypothetical protein [Aliarcobacter butzleri]KLE03717.1 hypothetical protein AF78_10215 [Aliarcobacter butzleri L353]MCT7555857.1 hypothetical protein [Aliarcobacter butzleri]MCT7620791.1 hypothetical protein [Aliarcobacter butzleri]MCT7644922.1 hypothetical protein [Aliarcobacter butzleri]MDN5051134.1 hypothetical protein [Aliarcobacter butzleri]
MNLLLVCETPIIEHIFTLVCKKMKIDLTIQKNNKVNKNYDLIVIDQNFVDSKFNKIKNFCKRIGAISSEELPMERLRDFIIPRPFLPTKLEALLIEQITYIKEDLTQKEPYKEEVFEYSPEDDIDILPVIDYLEEGLTESISKAPEKVVQNEYEEDDESIVSLSKLNAGGVLDSSELNKINDILHEDEIYNGITLEKRDWKDISSIIDDALEEVKEYEFDLKNEPMKTYNLVLSKYGIDELRPLLEKFDQTIIDKIASGQTIDLRVSLRDTNR